MGTEILTVQEIVCPQKIQNKSPEQTSQTLSPMALYLKDFSSSSEVKSSSVTLQAEAFSQFEQPVLLEW